MLGIVFGGLGWTEMAIILGIALIVLGPTKLPELARSLGKGIREFRKATEDFKSTIDDEVHRPEPKKSRGELSAPAAREAAADAQQDPPQTEKAPFEVQPAEHAVARTREGAESSAAAASDASSPSTTSQPEPEATPEKPAESRAAADVPERVPEPKLT